MLSIQTKKWDRVEMNIALEGISEDSRYTHISKAQAIEKG